ncbi:SpaA isopeptide-forming pilin-related protein [Rummeliibacillus sp. BSL5]
MKRISFIVLACMLILQNFIGPLSVHAVTNTDQKQSFNASISADQEGKAVLNWNLTAGSGNENKETYTFRSEYIFDTGQQGSLPVGSYSVSPEGVITVIVTAGQEKDAQGTIPLADIQKSTTNHEDDPPSEESTDEVKEVTKESKPPIVNIGEEDGTAVSKEETKDEKSQEAVKEGANVPEDETTPTVEIEKTVPASHISKITVLVDKVTGGKEDISHIPDYQARNGDAVTLNFELLIEAGHKYGEGSTLRYKLPEIFTNIKGNGEVGSIGSFKVENGEVVITFNGSIRDDANQGIEIHNASFAIGAQYSESNTQLEYDLVLPGQETIKLLFKPKDGNAITKSGKPENNGKSSSSIEWTVDINTKLDELSSASFKDVLLQGSPGKHKFGKKLSVIELIVNAKGEVAEGSEVSVTPIYNDDRTEVSFDLSKGKKAYRIQYDSVIDEGDSDSGRATYKNTASITNSGSTQEASNSQTVNWGPPIEKSVKSDGYGTKAVWTIKYNYNRKTIVKDKAILTDVITGDHKINNASDVKVYSEDNELIDASLYHVDVNSDGKGYTLSFNQDIDKTPYQIIYKTEKTDYFTKGGKVSNIITRKDNNKTSSASFNYSNPSIVKSTTGTNYNAKTIDWKIDVNKDSYEMNNIVITDTYEGVGMKFKEGSLKVIGLNEDEYEFEDQGNKGFSFKVKGTISKPFTITYTTDYEIKDIGANDRKYINKAGIAWETNSKNYTSNAEATANIREEQKANGYKKGVYNYKEKTFKWTVGINFNGNTIENAIFKDQLPEGHVVSQVEIKPVIVNPNGTVSPDESGIPITSKPDLKGNKIEIALGKITGAYEITYTSEIENGIFPVTVGNYRAKNTAELFDGENKNASWIDEVTVNYTDETLSKDGKGKNATSQIDWNLKLNYGQSKLSNIFISDAVGKDADGNPNQLILEDSFKVYEVTLAGESKNSKPAETKTLLEDGYIVRVDNAEGSFTLTFNEPITKAYYIEYSTIFLGAPNDIVENGATLRYDGITTGKEEVKTKKFNYWFSGSGSTKKVPLQLKKVDEATHEVLPGAKFALYNKDKIKLTEGTTNDNGELLFPVKLGEGKYDLKEIEAPTGYLKNPAKEIELKIASLKDGVQYETVTNKKIRQAIELTKTDAEGTPLSGVEFELRQKDESGEYKVVTGYEKLTTTEEGKINVDELEPGDYQLVETKALSGYWLDQKPMDFKVVKDQTEPTKATMKNDKQGELIVKKVDATDTSKPLAGAEFALYDGNVEIAKAVTNESGIATFSPIKYGEYTLKETEAPAGYLMNNEIATGIKVKIDSPIVETEPIKNEKILNAFKLIKKDEENGNFLAGAEFDLLYNDKDEIVKDKEGIELKGLKTNQDGEIQVGHLEPGNYRLIETKAPKYYLLDKKEHPFTITKNQTKFTEVFATNKRGKGQIKIEKVDASDHSILLDNVEFVLTNEKGTVKKTATTDKGIATFTDLPYDTYTIVETKAPSDYLLDSKEQTIVLDSENQTDNAIVSKMIENKKANRSVLLTKYNEDKTLRLKGAIFELRKATDNVDQNNNPIYEVVKGIDVEKLTSDETGQIFLQDLPVGKYRLVEIKAPSGYQLNQTPIEFDIVDQQKETVYLEKTNSRIPWSGGGSPGEPEKPTTPEQPGEPENPSKPEEPTKPEEPGKPEKPGEPEEPTKPEKPGKPEHPDNPEQPGKPENPHKPEDPNKPDQPSTSSDKPNVPGNSNNPNKYTNTTLETFGGKALPQTGEGYSLNMIVGGIASSILGLWMILYSFRKVRKSFGKNN